MGESQRAGISGGQVNNPAFRTRSDEGPRNPDGTWMAGVARGPIKAFPFPIGAKFGELTVLRYEQHILRLGRSAGWQPICRCSCGWEGSVDRHNIKAGRSTRCNTCGEVAAKTKRYWKYQTAMADEHHRKRLLNRLASCIGRCHNQKNAGYASYGGRGIYVYPAWRNDHSMFLRYAQNLAGWDIPKLELDRINVDGPYAPGNIRFVTRKENIAGRRKANDLSQRILTLEREIVRLRSEQLRTQQSIHGNDNTRSDNRS